MNPTHELAPRRLLFIDVLRLFAAFQMIQGHSIAAVLAPSYRAGVVFSLWTFLRGLTSVIFLFSAGFAFALAERRSPRGHARTRRVRRALGLLALGYALHTPLPMLLHASLAELVSAWAIVDVLQCIGVSLLSLELLCLLVSMPQARALVALLLALLLIYLAPVAESVVLPPAATLLGNYLTTRAGSLFPLTPWAGYLLAGFGLGTLCLRGGEVRTLLLSALASLALAALTWRALPLGLTSVSPGYSLVKLGCVLLLAAVLARLLRARQRLPRTLAILASQTLFLYVSHVLILYADGVGLAARLGNRHSPLFGASLALLLLVVSGGGALWLHALRAPSASGTRAAPSP